MNFKTVIASLIVVSLALINTAESQSGLSAILTQVAVGVFQGLITNLLTPADYQDTTIFGRSMRIKMCGDTCVQITDRASGITVVGTGATVQEALGDATKKIFDELLEKGLLSLHDLCDLHITFPHPDQVNCPGQVINPCDLIHPVITTPKPCVNMLGDSYCNSNVKKCEDHLYQPFMLHNCFKTCTAGKCQTKPESNDPCKVGY